MKIKKESGEFQEFSRIKFINSLKRSGIDEELAQEILKILKPKLSSGMSTRRLYRLAYKLIRKNSQKAASRYALPRALLSLGPDGFNFERFVASLMSRLGYEVKIGSILQGRCVSHEVDVIASKPGRTIFMECKFHNSLAYKEDIKTALYVDARRMDLASGKNKFDEFWLITNSKVSSDAQRYGQCSGLKIVNPYSPEKESLYNLIVEANAYPIGCLTSLRKNEFTALNRQGLYFVKDLLSRPKALDKVLMNSNNKEKILKEARTICSPF